jgi:hypothetical protein
MVRLALENAISNAIVHGAQGAPIVLGAYMEGDSIALYVENQIPEFANVTNDSLHEVCERARGNDKSIPLLPPVVSPFQEEPFEENYSLNEMLSSSQKMNLSTRSGIKHIHVACGGAGGSFDLKVNNKSSDPSAPKTVVLTCYFPAQMPSQTSSLSDDVKCDNFRLSSELSSHSSSVSGGKVEINVTSVMPDQLKVCAIDDSELIG